MALTPVKAIALLVFISAIGGATYGVQVVLGDNVASQLVNAEPLRETLNATGGHTVTYAVNVVNRGDAEATLAVVATGEAASGRSEARAVVANGNSTFFVPVEVSEDAAPGEHALTVSLLDAQGALLRERPALLTLNVLEPSAEGFAQGDSADVIYTGRITQTGRVFNTNDPSLIGHAFPKTETYRASPGLLPVDTVPRPSVVIGFYEGMLGMQSGESRTITFGPEKGYGNATMTETEPRDETLERDFELELRTESVQRDVFDGYVKDTNQGEGSDFEAGDVFVFEQGANKWPYRVVSIDAETVQYRLAVQEGESYTLFPFWENASAVASANETHVVFRTTPTTEVGETFTMKAHWPDMSAVQSVDDESIVVRHSPPVGFAYQVGGGPMQQPRQYTVQDVTDETITVATPSGNPLAGQTLTFDVQLVELKK